MDELWPQATDELRSMVEGGWYVKLWWRDTPGPKQYTFVAHASGDTGDLYENGVQGDGTTLAAAVLDLARAMRLEYPDEEYELERDDAGD